MKPFTKISFFTVSPDLVLRTAALRAAHTEARRVLFLTWLGARRAPLFSARSLSRGEA